MIGLAIIMFDYNVAYGFGNINGIIALKIWFYL